MDVTINISERIAGLLPAVVACLLLLGTAAPLAADELPAIGLSSGLVVTSDHAEDAPPRYVVLRRHLVYFDGCNTCNGGACTAVACVDSFGNYAPRSSARTYWEYSATPYASLDDLLAEKNSPGIYFGGGEEYAIIELATGKRVELETYTVDHPSEVRIEHWTETKWRVKDRDDPERMHQP